MIRKESVISWFKGLSGDDRIDLMCNLLDCSLPWEIRFFSTFLEAQVQRDYPVFRQAESTANNPTDLSCLLCLDDAHIRRRLCVLLALLHPTNRQAAAVLFGILNDYQPSALVEEEYFTELSLLMTMSAHHPAFSFHQKHVMLNKLKQLKHSANRTSDFSETFSEASSGSSTFSFEQDVPAKFEIQDDLLNIEQHTKDTDSKETVNSAPNDEDLPTVRDKTPQVYIKEIKVQAIERISERKSRLDLRKRDDHWYVLQVLWCDDTIETIHRTYEEMFDFQCKLRKMYPNKVDASGNPWKLPFLPGRIRMFHKPEQKGEKTPIPDITEYIRLFGTLPKFVRGCDHVVKFFQCNKKSRKKAETRKSKGASDKAKRKEFETPHRIAEAVREQSLAGKENNKKTADATNTKEEAQNRVSEENPTKGNKQLSDEQSSVVDMDENRNDGALLSPPQASLSCVRPFSSTVPDKFGTSGLVHSSAQTSVVTLQVSLPSSPVMSYPSPPSSSGSPVMSYPSPPSSSGSPVMSYPSPPSSSGSPVTSPTPSPCFPQRSFAGNVNWTFKRHGRAMTVTEWLRRLRLHKYSEVFRGKTFDEMLKLSDKDFENLGLTTGARRKVRVNLEVLRTSGCFTSNGLMVVDFVPSPPSETIPLQTPSSAYSSNFPISFVHSALCCNSDSELLPSLSESDSASDCGSDAEPGSQTGSSCVYPKTFSVLNGWRPSCYNCGSLGHVGGQCMAPNLDKKTSCGYHFKYEPQLEC